MINGVKGSTTKYYASLNVNGNSIALYQMISYLPAGKYKITYDAYLAPSNSYTPN